MPLKLLFVITVSVALGAFVAQYAGLQHPLRVTHLNRLDPIRAYWMVVGAEAIWLAANVYAAYLVYSSWKSPAGMFRILLVLGVIYLFALQFMFGLRALDEINLFLEHVEGPWS